MRCRGRRWRSCASGHRRRRLRFEPPHLSLYHLTLEPNTLFAAFRRRCRTKTRLRRCRTRSRRSIARPGSSTTKCRPTRSRASVPAQPQLLDLRRLPRHGRRCARQAVVSTTASCARRAIGTRAATWRLPLPARASQRSSEVLSREDLPFEFMLNALRLLEGVPAVAVRGAYRPVARGRSRQLCRGGAQGAADWRIRRGWRRRRSVCAS